jgi:hypothetical protein
VVGAHRDIHHREIATLILLAGGLLQGRPEGIRPPRLDPLVRAGRARGQSARARGRRVCGRAPRAARVPPVARIHTVPRSHDVTCDRCGGRRWPYAMFVPKPYVCVLPDEGSATRGPPAIPARDRDDPQPPRGGAGRPPAIRPLRCHDRRDGRLHAGPAPGRPATAPRAPAGEQGRLHARRAVKGAAERTPLATHGQPPS